MIGDDRNVTGDRGSFDDEESRDSTSSVDGRFEGGSWDPNDWNAAAEQQRNASDMRAMVNNEGFVNQFAKIHQQAQQKRNDDAEMRQRTLAAIYERMDSSGGYLTSDELGAFRMQLGDSRSILRGGMTNRKNGTSFIIGGVDTRDGRTRYAPLAGATIVDKMKLYNRYPTRNNQILSQKYYDKLAEKYTPDQIGKMLGMDVSGYERNRNSPDMLNADAGSRAYDPDSINNRVTGEAGGRVIGSTTFGGGTAARLFGYGGPNKGGISAFSSNGRGGFSRTQYSRKTGDYETTDYGTRDPNNQGRWSVVMSGPRRVSEDGIDKSGKSVDTKTENGKLYRNSKTGEETWVPDGSSLRQVMANAAATASGRVRRGTGRTFEEQKALEQMRINARTERDDATLSGRMKIEAGRRYDALLKEYDKFVNDRTNELKPEFFNDANGNERPMEDAIKLANEAARKEAEEKYGDRLSFLSDMIGMKLDDGSAKGMNDGQGVSSEIDNKANVNGGSKWDKYKRQK